jgi:hypothetical protein
MTDTLHKELPITANHPIHFERFDCASLSEGYELLFNHMDNYLDEDISDRVFWLCPPDPMQSVLFRCMHGSWLNCIGGIFYMHQQTWRPDPPPVGGEGGEGGEDLIGGEGGEGE